MSETTARIDDATRKKLVQMKGQAVPLYGYHVLRDELLAAITGDHQAAILYWAGKDLASRLGPVSEEDCSDLFLELGWGHLRRVQDSKTTQVYHLDSPFFAPRNVPENASTFSLECGFLSEAVSLVHGVNTEAYCQVHEKENGHTVIITVHKEKKSGGSP